jgi:Putative peptidoglycan binding domain
MNEDFLDLDLDLPQLIFVACMNEFDETRLQKTKNTGALTNPWLRTLCGQLNSMDALKNAVDNYVELAKISGHPGAPVDPVAHASSVSNNGAPTTSSPASESKIILAAQKALKVAKCFDGAPTGKEDASTDVAAKCFQKNNKLKETGILDMETLVALKVITSS